MATKSRLPVTVRAPADRYPSQVEAAAYFVVAEGLANVAKHARASHAQVRIEESDGELLISVEDDGIGGADPEQRKRASGIGGSDRSLRGPFESSNGCPNRNLAYRFTPADRCLVSYSAGSVNKLLPIPGLAEYGHGFRTIPEAIDLHDHHPPAGAGCCSRRRRGASGALHLCGGWGRLHRHRGRGAGPADDHPAGQDAPRSGRPGGPVDVAGPCPAVAARAR